MDLDGTLTIDDDSLAYPDRAPNLPVISKLREYRARGFRIAINTARNMRTHAQSIGMINAHTLPIIIDWLKKHDIPYDELYVGKPWADAGGFYVDDRSVRPSEFVSLNHEQILALTEAEHA